MVWRKYSIDTTVEAEEILAAFLMEELGIEGVEFSDQRGITEEEAKPFPFMWKCFPKKIRKDERKRWKRPSLTPWWIIPIP